MALFGVDDNIVGAAQRLDKLAGAIITEQVINARYQCKNTRVTTLGKDGDANNGLVFFYCMNCRCQEHRIAYAARSDEKD